jgi:hypothetical protein
MAGVRSGWKILHSRLGLSQPKSLHLHIGLSGFIFGRYSHQDTIRALSRIWETVVSLG